MRALFIALLMMLSVAGCGTTTMTRQDLVARMGTSLPYWHTQFFYMGTKNGCDYVTQRWKDYDGSHPEKQTFRFRAGELPVGAPMEFTADESRWRVFNPWAK